MMLPHKFAVAFASPSGNDNPWKIATWSICTTTLFAANPGAFKIVVGSREIIDIRTAYAEGAPGEIFGILGSMGYLEIVANRAAAAQITGASKGSEVSIVFGAASGKGA